MKKTKERKGKRSKSDEAARGGDRQGQSSPPAREAVPDTGTMAEGKERQAGCESEDSVEALRERIDKLTDGLHRAKADYQNLQRRSANEMMEAVRFANAALLKPLLTVLDDFDRTLAAAESTDQYDTLLQGVKLVHTNLLQILRSNGLETIEALHQPFDPVLHEAMMQQSTADHPPNTVVEEIAKGYRLRDRVLRPAKVVVSKKPNGGAEKQDAKSRTANPTPQQGVGSGAGSPNA